MVVVMDVVEWITDRHYRGGNGDWILREMGGA